MGKNLFIQGADFSKNSIEENYSGVCYLQINDYFNIVGSQAQANLFERKVGYYESSFKDNRIGLYENENRKILFVPKGATLTLRGVTGLLIDYCAYSRQHDPMDFRIVKDADSTLYVMQYGIQTARQNNQPEPAHPYALGTFSNKDSSKFYGFTDGIQDSVTLTADNTTDRYVIFFCKKTDNSVIDVGHYHITYEIRLSNAVEMYQGVFNVSDSENHFIGSLDPITSTLYAKRLYTSKTIKVASGESITLSGSSSALITCMLTYSRHIDFPITTSTRYTAAQRYCIATKIFSSPIIVNNFTYTNTTNSTQYLALLIKDANNAEISPSDIPVIVVTYS